MSQKAPCEEKVPERVDALRTLQVERLKAKALQREEKLEQVRRRRIEELEIRRWKLEEMLSTRRGGERRPSWEMSILK